MGSIYFLVKIFLIAKIINIPLFVVYFAIILQEVFSLSKQVIRKIHSYRVQTTSLHEEFRTSFMEFNNLINDLIILLKRIIRSFSIYSGSQQLNSEISIEKENFMIESIVYNFSKISSKTDEILQNIGGLEFYTNSIIDEFTNVLKDIEIQYNHVIKFYKTSNTNDNNLSDETKNDYTFNEFLSQLELEFVLLQEVVQNLIPKVNLLFDEFNEQERNVSKYSNTNNF